MLGIVLVNYKTIDETVSYVKRELVKIATPHKIVVVDVACEDIAHAREIAKQCGGQVIESLASKPDAEALVYVVPHEDNLGYAKGNNLGVEFLEKHFEMDYYLFTNNDIDCIDDDVVERLIQKADQLPDVGAIGPKVIGLDYKDQSPHMGPISIFRFIAWNVFYPYRALKRKHQTDAGSSDKNPSQSCYCYWVSGCFILVKASAFLKAGMFDPMTFLYGEEKILSERLFKCGFRNYFLPDVVIRHLCGNVTSTHHSSKRTVELDYRSNLHYYSKYITKSKLLILLFRISHNICQRIYKPIMKRSMNE